LVKTKSQKQNKYLHQNTEDARNSITRRFQYALAFEVPQCIREKERTYAFSRFMAMEQDEKMFQFRSFSNNKTQLGGED
jgi:hypothetical protein